MIQTVVSKGRTPLLGKPVNVVQLGLGELATGLHYTDAAGRIEMVFVPPANRIGRTQIGFSYQSGTETLTDTITIEYSTTRPITDDDGWLRTEQTYSEAHIRADAAAGLHFSQVAALTVAGADPEINFNQLEQIQRDVVGCGTR